MAKQTWINVSGSWRKVKSVWKNVGGTWKKDVMPKGVISGNWKEFMSYISEFVVVYNVQQQRLRLHDIKTGASYKTRDISAEIPIAQVGSIKVDKQGNIYVQSYHNGSTYVYDSELNLIQTKSSFAILGDITTDGMCIARESGKIYAFDLNNNFNKISSELVNNYTSNYQIDFGGQRFFTKDNFTLYCFDLNGNEIYRTALPTGYNPTGEMKITSSYIFIKGKEGVLRYNKSTGTNLRTSPYIESIQQGFISANDTNVYLAQQNTSTTADRGIFKMAASMSSIQDNIKRNNNSWYTNDIYEYGGYVFTNESQYLEVYDMTVNPGVQVWLLNIGNRSEQGFGESKFAVAPGEFITRK